MELFKVAEKIGMSMIYLSPGIINRAKRQGLITRRQAAASLGELRKADRIWKNPVPGVESAVSLW